MIMNSASETTIRPPLPPFTRETARFGCRRTDGILAIRKKWPSPTPWIAGGAIVRILCKAGRPSWSFLPANGGGSWITVSSRKFGPLKDAGLRCVSRMSSMTTQGIRFYGNENWEFTPSGLMDLTGTRASMISRSRKATANFTGVARSLALRVIPSLPILACRLAKALTRNPTQQENRT